jgi:hypothetical protein
MVPDDTQRQRYPIQHPADVDVLLGRGTFANRHAGNCLFRRLAASYRDAYTDLPKGQKAQLAYNLVNFVRLQGGRFLIQDAISYYECGTVRAEIKVRQALREGTAMVRREKEEDSSS